MQQAKKDESVLSQTYKMRLTSAKLQCSAADVIRAKLDILILKNYFSKSTHAKISRKFIRKAWLSTK